MPLAQSVQSFLYVAGFRINLTIKDILTLEEMQKLVKSMVSLYNFDGFNDINRKFKYGYVSSLGPLTQKI